MKLNNLLKDNWKTNVAIGLVNHFIFDKIVSGSEINEGYVQFYTELLIRSSSIDKSLYISRNESIEDELGGKNKVKNQGRPPQIDIAIFKKNPEKDKRSKPYGVIEIKAFGKNYKGNKKDILNDLLRLSIYSKIHRNRECYLILFGIPKNIQGLIDKLNRYCKDKHDDTNKILDYYPPEKRASHIEFSCFLNYTLKNKLKKYKHKNNLINISHINSKLVARGIGGNFKRNLIAYIWRIKAY